MKRFTLLLALAAGVLTASQALAADRPYKAPAQAPASNLFTWTGFYLGANAGYGWNKFEGDSTGIVGVSASETPSGFTAGIEGGYRYQFANRVVAGIVADINVGDFSANKNIAGPVNADFQGSLFGSVRGELGYAFEGFLVYGTVGYGLERGKVSVLGFEDTATHGGIVYGGGIASPITKNLFLKAEYLRYDLGTEAYSFVGPLGAKVDTTIDVARVGLQYRFGSY